MWHMRIINFHSGRRGAAAAAVGVVQYKWPQKVFQLKKSAQLDVLRWLGSDGHYFVVNCMWLVVSLLVSWRRVLSLNKHTRTHKSPPHYDWHVSLWVEDRRHQSPVIPNISVFQNNKDLLWFFLPFTKAIITLQFLLS